VNRRVAQVQGSVERSLADPGTDGLATVSIKSATTGGKPPPGLAFLFEKTS
jgi:hypothetical protein